MNSLASSKTLRLILALLAIITATLITPPTRAQNIFGALTTLHDFAGTDGSSPYGGLLRLSDGILYGVTEKFPQINNVYQGGSIYRIGPDDAFSTVHVLSTAEGSDFQSAPVQASDGNLYGTTSDGGPTNNGTVYRYAFDGTFIVIHSFNGSDGAQPRGSLIQGLDGAL